MTVGAPLIGIGLSRYYWENVYVSLSSQYSQASTLSIVFGGIIVLPLILRAIRWDGFWWVAGAVVLLALGIGLSWFFWEELHDEGEPRSATIRNLSLVIGGFIAIELSVWRSIVGERQTAVAQQQAETAQRGLLNERFQKGAEMLDSENLSVRLGGIYALQHLAEEHPETYHVQVLELLCAFVRHPTGFESSDPDMYVGEVAPGADVTAIVELICKRSRSQIQIEQCAEFSLVLSKADLRHCDFGNAELSGAKFYGAQLYKTSFAKANLSNAQFADAIFSDLGIWTREQLFMELGTKSIPHPDLREANVSGTSFSLQEGSRPAKGLLQGKLNEACADPDNIPKVDGVKDGDTGSPIVWGGNTCEQE